MRRLIRQRTPNDCAIATIAMATGRPYREVLRAGIASQGYVEGEGCHSVAEVLKALGLSDKWKDGQAVGDFVSRYRPFSVAPEYFRAEAWGRRAIFTVPSLNIENGHHSVYFDGRRVLDPNRPDRKRYTEFAQLMPSEVILFREAA